MTLRVEIVPGGDAISDTDFRNKVEQALWRLCPASWFTVKPTREIEQTPRGWLWRCLYCKTYRAGCNLLSFLVDSDDPFRFAPTGADATYRTFTIQFADDLAGWYSPALRTVYWDPCLSSEDMVYYELDSLDAVLAHELIHALHHLAGKLETEEVASWTDAPDHEEHITVRSENQIRRALGLTLRQAYTEPVKNYDCGTLPRCKQSNCRCLIAIVSMGVTLAFRAMMRFFRPRRPRPTAPEEYRRMMSEGVEHEFGDILDTARGQKLRRRLETALRMRERAPHRSMIAQRFDEFSIAVLLEGVDTFGIYRVILMAMSREGETKLITNLHRRSGPGNKLTGRPGDLHEFTMQEDVQALLEAPFEDGVGGQESVLDGIVWFMTMKDAAPGSRRAALYGVAFNQFTSPAEGPPGVDRERWDAMNEVLEVWRRSVPESLDKLGKSKITPRPRRPT